MTYIWPPFIMTEEETKHSHVYKSYSLSYINTKEQANEKMENWNSDDRPYKYFWWQDAPSFALNKAE